MLLTEAIDAHPSARRESIEALAGHLQAAVHRRLVSCQLSDEHASEDIIESHVSDSTYIYEQLQHADVASDILAGR